VKKIPLTKGKFAIVDDSDFERVNAFHWTCNTDGYATSKVGPMHRFILDAPKGTQVDHRNHDTLDNRRENIWLCTPSQNRLNNRSRNPQFERTHNKPTQVRLDIDLSNELDALRQSLGIRVSMAAFVESLIRKALKAENHQKISDLADNSGSTTRK
jgi:hypothetical protein